MKWVFRIFNFSEHILWCDYQNLKVYAICIVLYSIMPRLFAVNKDVYIAEYETHENNSFI